MNIKLTKTERLLQCGGLIRHGVADAASLRDGNEADNRRDMLCGNWESVEGKPDMLIYQEGEAYKVTVFRRSRRAPQAEAGDLPLEREENGNLYMNTGFRIDVAYNEETDVLTLLAERGLRPGGHG